MAYNLLSFKKKVKSNYTLNIKIFKEIKHKINKTKHERRQTLICENKEILSRRGVKLHFLKNFT